MTKEFDWEEWSQLSDFFETADLYKDNQIPLHPTVAGQYRTSTACPDQWEGQFENGDYFYFRYRSGSASLGISSESIDAAVSADRWRRVDFGHPMDGIFSDHAERQAVFKQLLEMRQDENEEEAEGS